MFVLCLSYLCVLSVGVGILQHSRERSIDILELVSDKVILDIFEGYDQNSRASRSNTTYIIRLHTSHIMRIRFVKSIREITQLSHELVCDRCFLGFLLGSRGSERILYLCSSAKRELSIS